MRHKSAVLALEEECVKRKVHVNYECLAVGKYTYKVKVLGMNAWGKANTIPKAKNLAALRLLQLWNKKDKSISAKKIEHLETIISPSSDAVLESFCVREQKSTPVYTYSSANRNAPNTEEITSRVQVGHFSSVATASNKKLARSKAAARLLDILLRVKECISQ